MVTRPRILVVDDDPMNRDILQTLLGAQGFATLTAVDGEEALAIAKAQRPDLILLDVMMPKVDGIEVCRRLRSDPAFPFMPIVMVTARSDSRDIVAGLEVGADEYLTKPVDPDALVARVKSMLRIKALHDTVQGQAAQLSEWNRTLEGRVHEQVTQLEHLGRREWEATKLYEVTSQLASNLDVDRVLDLITAKALEFLGGDASGLYTYDQARSGLTFHRGINLDPVLTRDLVLTPGEGVAGRAFQERRPVWTRDRLGDPSLQYRPEADALIQAKAPRAYLAVPILGRGEVYGVLVDYFYEPHDFTPEEIQLLSTLADHAAIAIENVRLLDEIRTKSRELEAASRHKSEFLANMSHELRTPLNAVIGFAEVLLERMFGEVNEKQEEYLRDIRESGRHLLSLIGDILDLSKIEAGRMELELADVDLAQAIQDALTLVRERAHRRGIALELAAATQMAPIRGDERKIKQVLLNLLSNAIKFTPEGGRIDVRALLEDDRVEVSVSDTGVGIAPEEQEAVFQEFRQVGASAAKQEGTGLGLALCRKFVELHGGKIWVRSELGSGSTFTFTLPTGQTAAS
jgi:signal transduction histidine kinase/DNA-binding response OmpR family regulator